jgi:DNA-binding transcriptional ArsR family regulator
MLHHSPIADVFQALGDDTRRRIIEGLTDGPQSVTALARRTGLTLAAIGQHVQVLEASRLVQTRKVGRVRTCALVPDGFQVAERWLLARRSAWEHRFDRLADLLTASTDPAPEEDPT